MVPDGGPGGADGQAHSDSGPPNTDASVVDAYGLGDAGSLDAHRTDSFGADVFSFPDAQAPDAAFFPDASLVDGSFMVGPHPALPQIPNQGGTRLIHPQLVTIAFLQDPNRGALEAHARWMVGSSWLTTVGSEYGIGAGSILGQVETASAAPAAISDQEIQAMLVNGVERHAFPRPAGGSFTNTLYMIYFPSGTDITLPDGMGGQARSCVDFGGYHDETDPATGLHLSYAVIPNCPGFTPNVTPLEDEEISASHELIEAATDAFPMSDPAWALPQMSLSPWVLIGGEIGDLCAVPIQIYRSGPFVAQRIWSNTAALANVDPCIPANPQPPYFNTAAVPEAVQFVRAGGALTFSLFAWSLAPVADWTLNAQPSPLAPLNPTVTLSRTTMNNGSSATLTVSVPAGATSGAFSLILLESFHSMDDFHVWPIVVVVQ
jgi:hypothetical protein